MMKEWVKGAVARRAELIANPEFSYRFVTGGANRYFGTINGRVATSMALATKELAIDAVKRIYAKNVKPGLPNPYV